MWSSSDSSVTEGDDVEEAIEGDDVELGEVSIAGNDVEVEEVPIEGSDVEGAIEGSDTEEALLDMCGGMSAADCVTDLPPPFPLPPPPAIESPEITIKALLPASSAAFISLEDKKTFIQDRSGTTIEVANHRAYRYGTKEMLCKITGTLRGIIVALEMMFVTLPSCERYVYKKEEGMKEAAKHLVKFKRIEMIVSKRIADRILTQKSKDIQELRKDHSTIDVVDILQPRTSERCIQIEADESKLIMACKVILMTMFEHTKSTKKRLERILFNSRCRCQRKHAAGLTLCLPNFSHGSLEKMAMTQEDPTDYTLFYDYLLSTGAYSHDYIQAMHFAEVLKVQYQFDQTMAAVTVEACEEAAKLNKSKRNRCVVPCNPRAQKEIVAMHLERVSKKMLEDRLEALEQSAKKRNEDGQSDSEM